MKIYLKKKKNNYTMRKLEFKKMQRKLKKKMK